MITDYFTHKQKPLITEYYELHRQFISRNNFATVYREIQAGIVANASRKSCVCMDARLMETFTIYSLPRIPWTETLCELFFYYFFLSFLPLFPLVFLPPLLIFLDFINSLCCPDGK